MEFVRADTDYLSQENLRELAELSDVPCLSLYMPAHKRSGETQQDPIRLRNLLNAVETELLDDGLRRPDVVEFLQPLSDLLDDYEFWQHQSQGLALFRTDQQFASYRLPIPFDEMTLISSRPHIKPLLPLITTNGHFFLLALSQNQVRLFEGTRFQIGEIDLGDTPTSLAEAMRFDEYNDQLQFHTQTGSNRGGERAAIFYGHSNAGDEAVIKENVKRFLQQVDTAVCNIIGEERAPLVLAGVEVICGLYNEITKYTNVVPERVAGNPETATQEELHAEAWPLVEPQFAQEQQQATDAFLHLAGTLDRRASSDLQEIVSGAYFQRVETLFVPLAKEQWGILKPESNQVRLHDTQQSGDFDLFDFAAVHTLLNGGTAYAVQAEQIPGQHSIACIFRY